MTSWHCNMLMAYMLACIDIAPPSAHIQMIIDISSHLRVPNKIVVACVRVR